MDYTFLADFFELIGGILIAYTVIAVHNKILHDHHLGKEVFKTIKKEQVLAAIGIMFLFLGFFVRYLF